MTPHLRQVRELRVTQLRQRRQARKTDEQLRRAVLRARDSHTLSEIGEAMGMTKQSVYGLLKREAR